jgi:hypothetical protein
VGAIDCARRKIGGAHFTGSDRTRVRSTLARRRHMAHRLWRAWRRIDYVGAGNLKYSFWPDWTVETAIVLQIDRSLPAVIPCCHWTAGGYLIRTKQRPDSGRSDFFPGVAGPDRPDRAPAGEAGLNDRLAVSGGGFGRGLFGKDESTNRRCRVIVGWRPSDKRTLPAIRRSERQLHG